MTEPNFNPNPQPPVNPDAFIGPVTVPETPAAPMADQSDTRRADISAAIRDALANTTDLSGARRNELDELMKEKYGLEKRLIGPLPAPLERIRSLGHGVVQRAKLKLVQTQIPERGERLRSAVLMDETLEDR